MEKLECRLSILTANRYEQILINYGDKQKIVVVKDCKGYCDMTVNNLIIYRTFNLQANYSIAFSIVNSKAIDFFQVAVYGRMC